MTTGVRQQLDSPDSERAESHRHKLQEVAVNLDHQRRVSAMEHDRLSTILSHMADGVLVVGPAGEQQLANEAYESMMSGVVLDRDAEDFSGQRLPAGRSPVRLAAKGESFSLGFTLTAPDGKRRWFEAIGAPLGESGSRTGGVVVIRDITDRNLRQLQEEFLALASHELRTPLAALRGYLQLLARSQAPQDRPETSRYASAALLQTNRLDRLVAELLDVTRLEHGRMELAPKRVDLVGLVGGVVEIAQLLADGQPVRLSAPAGDLMIEADEVRLEQALLNVLGNAIQHAPDSPTVDVELRRARDRAVVKVTDHGPGMSRDVQTHAFDRFSQVADGRASSSAGLGLGLYITRAIIKGHDGRIQLRSEPGVGTTVTISLPRTKAAEKRRSPATSGPRTFGRGASPRGG